MAHAKVAQSEKSLKGEVKVNGFDKVKSVGRGKKRILNESPESPSKKVKVVQLKAPQVDRGVTLAVGTGDIGQLGLGPDIEERTRPAFVSSLPSDIVAVAAGGLHSLCLTKDGKIYSWGCNDEGGLGRPTTCEEDNFSPGEIQLDGKVVQISAGDCHSAALMEDGRVFAWGSFRDNSGPLGFLERETLQKEPRQIMEGVPVKEISSGNNHLALLTAEGQVFTCGCGESGQLGRVAEVFATRNIRNRGSKENLLVPLPLKVFKARKLVKFDAIWAGGYATFIRSADTGSIYAFGLNNYCQLGDEDINMKFQPVLLKAFEGKKMVQFSPGQHHSLALDEDGVLYAMGRNEYGRLGLGENAKDATTPTPLPQFSKFKTVFINAGECVSFAVTEAGEAFGFGMGTNNQLGQGDEDDCFVPTLVKGKQLEERKVVSVSAGGQHTVLLAVPK